MSKALKQKYEAYVREYVRKSKDGIIFDRDEYKDRYGKNKWTVLYKEAQAKGMTNKKGNIMEPMLSYKEFEEIERNRAYSGQQAPTVNEYIKSQTLKLTGRAAEVSNAERLSISGTERAATRAALEQIKNRWEQDKLDEILPNELRESLKSYFNMSYDQQTAFLSGALGEVWRAWVFEVFADFAVYFNYNSPKDEGFDFS